ncbi:MAG: hypothetical protein RLZZ32_1786 [Cyanobacteriota bacterium]|jgi:hypothetical protein
MADLAVQKAKPIAEIPLAALQVASHFPSRTDERLNMIVVQPGEGDVALLRAASATDVIQVCCQGYAERTIRLPVGAVRWVLKRHPEAEVVAVMPREIGVTLRTFSAEATVGIGCIESESDVLDDGLPEVAPDPSGLELLFDHGLLRKILGAFGQTAKVLEFKPFVGGMRIETEGNGWTAIALLAGRKRVKAEDDEEPQEASARHHQPQDDAVERELALAGIDG